MLISEATIRNDQRLGSDFACLTFFEARSPNDDIKHCKSQGTMSFTHMLQIIKQERIKPIFCFC